MSTTIQIPDEGFAGIEALIRLGPNGIAALRQKIADQKPTLELSALVRQWAPDMKVPQAILRQAILSALMPLNQMRVSAGLEPEAFLAAITESLEVRAERSWKDEHLDAWKALVPQLPLFFEPDSLLSVISRGFELLANRQATLLDLRFVTELRPLFNEAATKTQALILTNTLVLEFVRGKETHTLHLALDLNDLQAIADEVKRVQRQNQLSRKEAKTWKLDLLSYGETGG